LTVPAEASRLADRAAVKNVVRTPSHAAPRASASASDRLLIALATQDAAPETESEPEADSSYQPLQLRLVVAEGEADAARDTPPPPEARPVEMDSQVLEIGPPLDRPPVSPEILRALAPPSGPARRAHDAAAQALVRAAQDRELPMPAGDPINVHRTSASLPDGGPNSWPNPQVLRDHLDRLAVHSALQSWCCEVVTQLDLLRQAEGLDWGRVGVVLDRLQTLAEEGQRRAADAQNELAVSFEVARVAHAIQRRVNIWQQLRAIAAPATEPVSLRVGDSQQLARAAEGLSQRLDGMRNGELWRDYLMVHEVQRLASGGQLRDTAQCRKIARQALLNMDYAALSPSQRTLLEQPEFAAYLAELKQLAIEPVDYLGLLRELERYECQPSSLPAETIARAQQSLRWSNAADVTELGRRLDIQYRNANLRVAVAADLINRLIPPPSPVTEQIDEFILGTRTWGRGEAVTRLKVQLIPSDRSWRFGLELDGDVSARTRSVRGPVTFFNRARSSFLAEKEVVVHPGGIAQSEAAAVADSRTQLDGVRTEIDDLPLLGELVGRIARRQYEQNESRARWESERRLAGRVGTRMDKEVRQQLDDACRRFNDHFYEPLHQLGLQPLPLEMRTTEQRVIARYRLAGFHQLAAHTPRPLAPGDSWLSIQMHESAANNFLEQLGWQGKRLSLNDIIRQIGELFRYPQIQPPEDLPGEVSVRFAERDPIRVAFQQGRVTVTLDVSELTFERRTWKNFVVRVHYQPDPEDPQVDLVRDQYVELIGRMAFRDQVALRGVFSRVFSKEQPVDIISRRLAEDPRLAGLRRSQLEIVDGWLAIAVSNSPEGPSESTDSATAPRLADHETSLPVR
jgi:hypothetical protein